MVETTLAAASVRIAHDKTTNLRRFFKLTDEAAGRGADILVLSEVGVQGYADFALRPGSKKGAKQRRSYHHEAETISGSVTERTAVLARQRGMLIQLGLAKQALYGNATYKSAALVGPGGIIGAYRKIHNIFEFPYFSTGEETPVFQISHGAAASLICFDFCFLELLRTHAVKGAEIVLMSTAWPMKGHHRAADYHGWPMDLAAQNNAFFNQNWLVVSNHYDTDMYCDKIDYYGNLQIIDPHGKVVACLGTEEGLVTHRADLREAVLQFRTKAFFGLNLLQERRPERYSALLDPSHCFPGEALRPVPLDAACRPSPAKRTLPS